MNVMGRIERTTASSWDGLGHWLEKVERIGELKRITAPVDPDLEMATITYMPGKTVGGPTLLFENIKGHPGGRVLFNPFGTQPQPRRAHDPRGAGQERASASCARSATR